MATHWLGTDSGAASEGCGQLQDAGLRQRHLEVIAAIADTYASGTSTRAHGDAVVSSPMAR